MSAIVRSIYEVCVGAVIAYPAQPRRGRSKLDWLRVRDVEQTLLRGVRLHPAEKWDPNYAFVVTAVQIADNGVEVVEP